MCFVSWPGGGGALPAANLIMDFMAVCEGIYVALATPFCTSAQGENNCPFRVNFVHFVQFFTHVGYFWSAWNCWRTSWADNSAIFAVFPSSVSPLSPSFVGSGRETVVGDKAQFAESLFPASSPKSWSSQAVGCLNLSVCWGIIIGYWIRSWM